jgi:hypothetical protein
MTGRREEPKVRSPRWAFYRWDRQTQVAPWTRMCTACNHERSMYCAPILETCSTLIIRREYQGGASAKLQSFDLTTRHTARRWPASSTWSGRHAPRSARAARGSAPPCTPAAAPRPPLDAASQRSTLPACRPATAQRGTTATATATATHLNSLLRWGHSAAGVRH